MDFYISLSLKDFMLNNYEYQQMSMHDLRHYTSKRILFNNCLTIDDQTLRISQNILINNKQSLVKKDRHVRFAI